MKKLLIFGALAALSCPVLAAPALAKDAAQAPQAETKLPETGWDYARWGMDAKAVIAASNGNAVATDATAKNEMVWNHPNGAAGVTMINGRDYSLKFFFDPKDGDLTFAKIGSEDKADCTALASYYQSTVKSAPNTIRQMSQVKETSDDNYWTAPIGGNKYAHFAVSLSATDICFIIVADANATIKRQ